MDSRIIAEMSLQKKHPNEICISLPAEVELDTIAMEMMKKTHLKHFSPCQIREENGMRTFHYECTHRTGSGEMLKWDALSLHRMIEDVQSAWEEAEDHLIPASMILWQVDSTSLVHEHFRFLILPIQPEESDPDLSPFFYDLLERYPWEEDGDLRCFAVIFNALRERPFGIQNLIKLRHRIHGTQKPLPFMETCSAKDDRLTIEHQNTMKNREGIPFLEPRVVKKEDAISSEEKDVEDLTPNEEIRWLENHLKPSSEQKESPIHVEEQSDSQPRFDQTSELPATEIEAKTEIMSLYDLLTRFSFQNLRTYRAQKRDARKAKDSGLLWKENGQLSFRDTPEGLRLRFSHEEIPVHKSPFTIGRAQKSDLILNHHDVSMEHATIYEKHHRYYLVDSFSTNGTWLNNERLIAMESRELHAGDRIRFGKEEAVFLCRARV